MAHEIGVTLRGDPTSYEQAIDRVRTATDEWVLSSESGAEDVDDKFADVIRSVVEMGKAGGRSRDDIEKMLRGIGLDADDAVDALKAVEREEQNIGDSAAHIGKAGDAVADVAGKASGVGDSLRDLGSIAKDVLSGDFGSAAEGALGSIATLGAGLGVAGAVGGAVAGALGGLVNQLVTAWDPFSAKTREVRDDVAAALTEMGGAFDESAINDRLRAAAADTDTWNQATLLAQATGMSLSDSLRAVAGVAQGESAAAFDELQRATNDSTSAAQTLSRTALRDLEQTLQGNADGFSDAATRADTLTSAMQGTAAEADENARATKNWADQLRGVPATTTGTLVLKVDDSAIRNYRPPVIQIRARIAAEGGASQRQLIQ